MKSKKYKGILILCLLLLITACSGSSKVNGEEIIKNFLNDENEVIRTSTELIEDYYPEVVKAVSFEGFVARLANKTDYEIKQLTSNSSSTEVSISAITFDYSLLFSQYEDLDDIIDYIDNNEPTLAVEETISIKGNTEKLEDSSQSKVINVLLGKLDDLGSNSIETDEEKQEQNQPLKDPLIKAKSKTKVSSFDDPVSISTAATYDYEKGIAEIKLDNNVYSEKETRKIVDSHDYNKEPIPGFALTEVIATIKHKEGSGSLTIKPTDFKVYDENREYLPFYLNFNNNKDLIVDEENAEVSTKITIQYPPSAKEVYITFKDYNDEFIIFKKSF